MFHRPSPNRALFPAALFAALTLAACNGSSAASEPSATASQAAQATPAFTPGTKAQPRVVLLTTSDRLAFDPATISVVRGETVTFQIKNLGTVEHEFMIGPAADVDADR